MLVNLDRYLMLLLRQFHLEHIQSLAGALMTLTAGGCEAKRDRETLGSDRESNGESDRQPLIDKLKGGQTKEQKKTVVAVLMNLVS